jgi:pyruvate dehydrogenase E1 component beta subunit
MAPSTPADAKGMLKTAIRDDNPVMFFESEVAYGYKGEVPDGEHLVPIGVGDVKREGKDITLVAWSKMVATAMEAANILAEEGIEAEVVDPRTIRPLDEQILVTSVEKTNRCVIVEEATPFASVGSEIAQRITTLAFDHLDAPVIKVNSEDVPMPYAANLEKAVLPNAQKVVAAAKKVLYI